MTHAFVPTVSPSLRAAGTSLSTSTAPVVLPSPAPRSRSNASPLPLRAPAPVTGAGDPRFAGGVPRRVAVWLLADLRVGDNPALAAGVRAAKAAGAAGALVPLVAGLPKGRFAAARGVQAELKAAGSGLVVEGGAGGVLEVVRRCGLDAVFFNRATGKEDVELQTRIVKELEGAGVVVRAFWGNMLREPLGQGIKESYLEVSKKGGEVGKPEKALKKLPALPEGAAGAGILGGGKVIGRAEGERVLQLACTKESEKRIAISARGGDPVWRLKEVLEAGVVSSRMVAERIVKVVGKLEGKTAGELVWRDYVCEAAHRAAGVKAGASQVAL